MRAQVPSEEALQQAAVHIGCDLAAIRAVSTVEAGTNGAFLTDTGEPVILFEPHLFSRLTNHRFDFSPSAKVPVTSGGDRERYGGENAKWRLVSRPLWTPGSYGPVSVQHRRLRHAATLDRVAALSACSWGLYQVLGMNYERAGHSTLQSFINAAYLSVNAHLSMFVAFILSDSRLVVALRTRDWELFARHYNGPGQVVAYARKLKVAHEVHSSVANP